MYKVRLAVINAIELKLKFQQRLHPDLKLAHRMIRAHFGRRFGFTIADHFVEHGIVAREHFLQAVEVGAVTDVDHGDQ